ncbi:hypothetical protein BJV82DRAFT_635708 [Fennellomyces sp. T-0311]|nr:hypothetical protein BJV82DRAFT_635708 [Fennellomyces sp. T-0311]
MACRSAVKCEYYCSKCSTRFTRIRDRIRHDKSVHGKGERFQCSYCEKTFTRKDSRVRHEHQCKKDRPIKVIQQDSKKNDDAAIPMDIDSSSDEDDSDASKRD